MAAPAGFPTPLDAINAVVACLGAMPTGWTVHTGSAGSGNGLDCCPGLLRVESTITRPNLGEVTFRNLRRGKCASMIQDIDIIWRECWTPFVAGDGPKAGDLKEVAHFTAMGHNVILSGWQAIARLACCAYSERFKFLALINDQPDGCIGWTMQVSTYVELCVDCPE